MNHFKEHGSHYKAIIFNFSDGEDGYMRLVVTAPPEDGDIVLTRQSGDTFQCGACGELLLIADDISVNSIGKTHAARHSSEAVPRHLRTIK